MHFAKEEVIGDDQMKHSAVLQVLLSVGLCCASLGSVTLAYADTASSANSGASWSPVVTQAMQYVKMRSDMQLQAPLFIGDGSGEPHTYLAATAQASANEYEVSLQLSTTPLGLNSPALDQGPNTALSFVIGGFGAKAYPSHDQALAQVQVTQHTPSEPGGYVAPDLQQMRASRTYIGDGVWGTVYAAPYDDLLEWREGDWFFQVQDMSASAAHATAASLVAFLHTHLLPETYGMMTVVDAGDGQHTVLSFAQGAIVYTDWDYHDALAAARMAVSMRSYVGAPEQTFPDAISRALTAIQNQVNPTVAVPLAAPRNFLLGPAQWSALQTQWQTASDAYTVSLVKDDPASLTPQLVAQFGAQTFAGSNTALYYVEQMSGPPNFAGLSSQRISLGSGIAGKLYNQLGLVRWHEGLWTLQVEAGTATDDIALAARIAAFLHVHLLPETHGFMWVKDTPAGDFSHLYWTFGDTVYNVYSVSSALQALQMAVSSESY